MNTIIIKPNIVNINLEVHFNLWNSDANNLHFLDIGIMCDNKDQKIHIEIPSDNELKIKDLSDELKGDIRNSIFNCNVNKQSKDSFEILTKPAKNGTDYSFLLSPINKSELSPSKEHNQFDLSVRKQEIEGFSIDKKYIRIRIENLDMKKFIICQDSESKIFDSSYYSNTIIDFRFNDYKLLSSSQLQELRLQNENYSKVHFLYMTDILENIDVCSGKYSVRFLERNIWNNYLDLPERKKDMLAYHLKDENVSNASFLIKAQQQKTSVTHLIFYAFVVIYLAVIANFVFSFIPLKEVDGTIKIVPTVVTGGVLLLIFLIVKLFIKHKNHKKK